MAKRVLIADDEEDKRKAYSFMVRRADSQAEQVIVDNGNDLEARAREAHFTGTPFTLILTDNTMPGMTGVQAVEEIRKYDSDTYIIMTSGDVAPLRTEKKALEAGVNEFYEKTQVSEIAAAVQRRLADS